MKTKILFIDQPPSTPWGGQKSLLALIQHLDNNAYDAEVLLPYECVFSAQLRQEGIKTSIVPPVHTSRALSDLKPDMIHCNSATTRYTFWIGLLARMKKIPFIWHVRVSESAGWKDRVIALLATRIIAISDTVQAKFSGNNKKVIRIYNAVDVQKFKNVKVQGSIAKELGISAKDKMVGIFSRLEKWKGQELFLEAARKVNEQAPQVKFLIVGEGEAAYTQHLQYLAEKLGLSQNVFFLGYRDDVEALLQQCDCVVHASIEPEPFGRTIIEAMAAEKVIVSTNVGGPAEIIQNEEDGLLVRIDAEEMAHAIVRVLEDSALVQRLTERASQKVDRDFNMKTYVPKIEALYRACQE